MGRTLQTDLYELTMAAAYFRAGMQGRRVVCEAFVRHLPKERSYLIACGLEPALRFLERFRFEEDELDWLASTPAMADALRMPGFREFLRDLRFTGDVWALPEGTAFFGGEPMLRVEAPLVEAQLVETFLLSTLNHGAAIASKAARIVDAARGRAVVEFGSRRTHPDAAVDAARAAFVGGCAGTSNLEAGMRWGIPVFGTAAHMYTMVHDTELDAFRNYVAAFPHASTLLVDTYDTLEGTRNAVRAGGPALAGVRLDSGDFLALSRAARRILDDGGARDAKIVASGDLEERRIARLCEEQAPIDVFGVGTELAVSKDAPALGGVYKVVAVERGGAMAPTAKFSEAKVTWPSSKQIFRHRDEEGRFAFDELALATEPAPGGAEPLLRQVMRGGRRTAPAEPLGIAQERCLASVAALPPWLRGIGPDRLPRSYEVRPTAALTACLLELRERHPPAGGGE